VGVGPHRHLRFWDFSWVQQSRTIAVPMCMPSIGTLTKRLCFV
jgi:hypothetical protein